MCAARELGHHATEPLVDVDLARDEVASTVSRSTTATAVSSQDVSIPKTFTERPS